MCALFSQGGVFKMEEEIKTCILCANPCSQYFNEVAPACAELISAEQTELRVLTASTCGGYKEREYEI